MSLVRRDWKRHAPLAPRIRPELLAYQPRAIILPTQMAADLASGIPLSYGAGITQGNEYIQFRGTTSTLNFGSAGLVSENSHTLVLSSQLDSFTNAFPMVGGYNCTTNRKLVWYSSSAGYTDITWNTPNSTSNRFSLSGFGPVAGTRHNLVFRGNGSGSSGGASGWCNGVSIAATAAGVTSADSGVNRLGNRGDTSFPFSGRVWVFALFDSNLPDAWCQRLSTDPYAIFAPRRIFIQMAGASSGIPTLSAATVFNIAATTARPRVTVTF